MIYITIIIAILAVFAILLIIGAARLNAEYDRETERTMETFDLFKAWIEQANAQFRADETWQEYVS